jgi:hypothetical protein
MDAEESAKRALTGLETVDAKRPKTEEFVMRV